MKEKKLYKFLREGLKSEYGKFQWEIGKWYKEDGIKLCSKGFHASERIGQAFSYVQGELLAEVSVRGSSKKGNDKEVWSEMKIDKVWKWQKKDSVAMAIYSAELCLENFEKSYPEDKRPREAIEAAKRWLDNPTKKNESAAKSAVWSAESAAWSAKSAAWSAKSAAWSAKSAVWSAESAAWSAESAAWSAKSAAKSAVWSAESAAWSAWSAARSAKSAAKSAICKKIYDIFDEQLSKLEIYEN